MTTFLPLRVILDEHHALSSSLQSLGLLLRSSPGQDPRRFFDTINTSLLYIEKFPQALHDPNENVLLFPRVVAAAPHLGAARRGAARRGAAIQKLESHHQHGGGVVRELQHLLLKGLLGPHRLGA